MQELWIENLKEVLENHERRMEHQIIIWGASPKSDRIFSVLENWGLPIAGYIDKDFNNDCKFDSFIKVRCSCGGSVRIESNCTMQRQCTLVASFDARIILGKDCMVSYSVFMRAGNSHNMIDLNSMEHLDDNAERDVICGEHVWVGMRVTLLNGVEIGAGSTVGANSFVCKKKFPPNCCLAGIPAKIIRERTVWIRDGVSMHKDIEDYQEFIYDEQY